MTPEALVKFMTFQVALIGTDGWVLASDERAYDLFAAPTSQGAKSVAPMSRVSKIIHPANLDFIYALSGGNDLSRDTGRALEEIAGATAKLPPAKRRDALADAQAQVVQQKYAGQRRLDGALLVLFESPQELWSMSIPGAPVQYKEFAFGGAGNLAMLYVQRHYQRVAVSKLKFLAAHTVLEGHFCNPSVVEGLELYWSENGVIHRATDAELQGLRKRSEAAHSSIDALLVTETD